MSGEQKKVRACEQCGATIEREQFINHSAARYKGKLLCPDCVQALKAKLLATRKASQEGEAMADVDDAPIALVDLDEEDKPRVVGGPSDQIRGFTGGEMTVQKAEQKLKRPLLKNTQSATRCRTFHCKLTDASFQNLNEQINEWVDERDDVEIKFALSSIGVVEGKHADAHLIVTIFY